MPPPSHNDLDREGWQVVEERGPTMLLDGTEPPPSSLIELELDQNMSLAVVFDESGSIVAALSVSAPTVRVDPDRLLADLGPLVSGAAERLSAELGFTA